MAKTLVRSTFLTERARASEHARDEQFMMSNSTSVISNHSNQISNIKSHGRHCYRYAFKTSEKLCFRKVMVFHKEQWSTFPRDKRQIWKHPADAGNQTSRSNRTSVCLYAFWSATDNSKLRPQCYYLSWRKVCLDDRHTWQKGRTNGLLPESTCANTSSGWASWEILTRLKKL